jgi:hypothetical protein
MVRITPISAPSPEIVMDVVTDPDEIAKTNAQMKRFDRNFAWMQTHAAEVNSHRGKIVCIAGEELFVGDDVSEVVTRAQAAHPDEIGWFTCRIPKEKAIRIYAHRR